VLILIDVCWVCVCDCVLSVGATFSYHTGRKSTPAKAKMANFCTLISKNLPPNTLNITGCANLSSFRDVAHAWTYWCKAVWAMLGVRKKCAKNS
jgi:hypothetical protein